ncbi:MAG: DM13 domain-containing protein, partial [Candidatus Methylomirabilales bacterium]
MQRRTLVVTLGIILLGAAWYLFRPELLFINRPVNEAFPARATAQKDSHAPTPVVLLQGRFHGVAHEGRGVATLHQLPDGKRVLRFTKFATSNGPDLFVYMVAAADASDNATVKRAGFISLGPLKGNVGDQNYTVPRDLDLATYRSVSIWCRRFGVNFATAPLA